CCRSIQMILALPRILFHFNILWYMLPKGISQERALEFTAELVSFIGGLANEGERTLVIGGAARIDVAIERLLRAVMQHHPGGNDNLFDPDRPLGTFSAKISLAYRLGLLDDGVE